MFADRVGRDFVAQCSMRQALFPSERAGLSHIRVWYNQRARGGVGFCILAATGKPPPVWNGGMAGFHEREGRMKRIDLFTKVMLAAIAAGLWVLILRPVFTPGDVRAAVKAGVPKVVRAQRFEVVDSKGKRRASLSLGADGSPALNLLDKHGKARAALSVGADGSPALALFDKDRKVRAVLALLPDGRPLLAVHDKDGRVLWKAP